MGITKFQRRNGHDLLTAGEHIRALRRTNGETRKWNPWWALLAAMLVGAIGAVLTGREPLKKYVCNIQRTECFWLALEVVK